MILLSQPSELHGLNHPAHLSCFFLACRELAKLCVQGFRDAAEETQRLLGFSVVLRSAMLPFHGDPSFWLLTFRCTNTEGLNSRRAAPGSHSKNCGGWGVRNPSQVQHLLGFVCPSILRIADQRAIKIFLGLSFHGWGVDSWRPGNLIPGGNLIRGQWKPYS